MAVSLVMRQIFVRVDTISVAHHEYQHLSGLSILLSSSCQKEALDNTSMRRNTDFARGVRIYYLFCLFFFRQRYLLKPLLVRRIDFAGAAEA